MKNTIIAVIVGVMLAGCGGTETQSDPGLKAQASKDAAVSSTTCDTGMEWWSPGVINTNLTVPAGKICRIAWGEVKGNVSVQGDLQVIAMTFDKNVTVDGGSIAGINWGSTFHGNLSIVNSAGSHVEGGSDMNGFWNSYGPTTIDGNFSYLNNTIRFYTQEQPTTVKGNFTYSGSPCGSTPTVLGASNVICQ